MRIKNVQNAPSLQHLVRLIDLGSAEKTAKRMIDLRDNGPTISTYESREFFGHALDSNINRAWLLRQVEGIKSQAMKKAAQEIIPLADEFRYEFGVEWFRKIPAGLIQLARGVTTPVKPLGVVGIEGLIYVLWPQVWKTITLDSDQFSLLCTIIYRKIILSDPQISGLFWIEMSAPDGKNRKLQVRTLEAARLYTELELNEISRLIEDALRIVASVPRKQKQAPRRTDLNQGDLDL